MAALVLAVFVFDTIRTAAFDDAEADEAPEWRRALSAMCTEIDLLRAGTRRVRTVTV
jgi:hypothetical protein